MQCIRFLSNSAVKTKCQTSCRLYRYVFIKVSVVNLISFVNPLAQMFKVKMKGLNGTDHEGKSNTFPHIPYQLIIIGTESIFWRFSRDGLFCSGMVLNNSYILKMLPLCPSRRAPRHALKGKPGRFLTTFFF